MNINDYQSIHGWFDHETDGIIYDYVVSKISSYGTFAECGVWLGRSTTYLNYLIKSKNLSIKHYAFDNFNQIYNLKSDIREANTMKVCKEVLNEKKQLDIFLENKEKFFPTVHLVDGDFNIKIKNFPDGYFDCIYIDMAHDYDSVYSNLENSISKLSKDGILCGHDYGYSDVNRAVNDFNKKYLNKEIKNMSGSFLIEL